MKYLTKSKGSNKCMVFFVAVSFATLLMMPQVPKAYAYLTSKIISDEITFTYETLRLRGFVYYDADSSMVFLTFPELDVRDMRLSRVELNLIGEMKLSTFEGSHIPDTYTVESWGSQDNQVIVYLDKEAVKSWLTNLYPDDTTFHLQISGEGDYKGARIQFSGLDSIFLEYVPEPVEVVLPPGEGTAGLEPPPVVEESSPVEAVPEPEADPVTEVPSGEPIEEPAVEEPDMTVEPEVEEPDVTEEPSEDSFEDPENESAEKPAEKPEEVVTGEAEDPSEAPPSEDSGGEEPVHHGGETQHD